MPPAIAFLDAGEVMSSGSPLYRVHRPAYVLGTQLDWITLVTHRHAPPTEDQPWMIEVEGQALCPGVLIIRPTMLTEVKGGPNPEYGSIADNWDSMRRRVEQAQKHGQIVMLDLDDHPYAWNALHPDDPQFSGEQWQIHDAYLRSFNAILCSTQYLKDEVLRPRFPEQRLEYAPNLYDPWRYDPSKAKFGKVLGSHLYVKARDNQDFKVLGDGLGPIFDADPELSFMHIGEEFNCTCSHRKDEHFHDEAENLYLECDHCACAVFTDAGHDSLSQASGLPSDRITARPTVSPWDLPNSLDYNVGVIPLADSTWNYAKTEGKGFEMAAAGIPFIALTGNHPLYRQASGAIQAEPGVFIGFTVRRMGNFDPSDIAFQTYIKLLTQSADYWKIESKAHRAWAKRIAQEHQIEYIATMKRLASANLAKS